MYGRHVRTLIHQIYGDPRNRLRRKKMAHCTVEGYRGLICPDPKVCGESGCQYQQQQEKLKEQHNAYVRAPGRIQWNPEGSTPPPDPVTEAIRADMLQRQRTGWTRYGIGLGRGDFTMRDWLHHLYEELLDAAQYTKRLMMTIDGTLPVVGERENIEIKTELPAQEIARLTREIGERQARVLLLVGGDPLKGVGLENKEPVLSKAVYASPICIFKYCPNRNECEPSGTCLHPVQGQNEPAS